MFLLVASLFSAILAEVETESSALHRGVLSSTAFLLNPPSFRGGPCSSTPNTGWFPCFLLFLPPPFGTPCLLCRSTGLTLALLGSEAHNGPLLTMELQTVPPGSFQALHHSMGVMLPLSPFPCDRSLPFPPFCSLDREHLGDRCGLLLWGLSGSSW